MTKRAPEHHNDIIPVERTTGRNNQDTSMRNGAAKKRKASASTVKHRRNHRHKTYSKNQRKEPESALGRELNKTPALRDNRA